MNGGCDGASGRRGKRCGDWSEAKSYRKLTPIMVRSRVIELLIFFGTLAGFGHDRGVKKFTTDRISVGSEVSRPA
jgi:hypothetical protein